MYNLPSQQEIKVEQAIAKFQVEGLLEIDEPCDCGDRVRHNNGGNYHQWIVLQKDGEKVFAKFGDTCELKPAPEWEEATDWQKVVRQNADWL